MDDGTDFESLTEKNVIYPTMHFYFSVCPLVTDLFWVYETIQEYNSHVWWRFYNPWLPETAQLLFLEKTKQNPKKTVL